MKVFIRGQGELSLTQGDFVASGGEGAVYVKGSTAYKVYHDPSKMIPTGKIGELATLTDAHICRPDKVLLDPKTHTPVGYTTAFVKDGKPLCTLFTRSFREREGLDHQKMLE